MSVFTTMLISLLIVGGVFAFVFWKIIKANRLLPASFSEWRRMSVIEGEVKLAWNVIPPLWQRGLVMLAILALFGLYIFGNMQGWFEPPRRVLSPLIMIVFGIVMVATIQLFPRRYQMTELGLWYSTASLFSNPASPRCKPRRLIWWKDVASYTLRQREILIYSRLPEKQSAYSLPHWMLKIFKRIEVPLSGASSELKSKIRAYIENHCSSKDREG